MTMIPDHLSPTPASGQRVDASQVATRDAIDSAAQSTPTSTSSTPTPTPASTRPSSPAPTPSRAALTSPEAPHQDSPTTNHWLATRFDASMAVSSSASADDSPRMSASESRSTAATSPMQDSVDSSDGVVSKAMADEEAKMAKISSKEDGEREERFAREREADRKGGAKAVDKKFKALEYLLSQSKLYSTIMLNQMQKQEEADNAKDARAQKKALKHEEEADKAAQDSQRRSTRHGAATDSTDAKTEESTSPKKRGRPAKTAKKSQQGKMTDFIKREDVEEKAGKGATVQDALEEEAAQQEKDGVLSSEIGIQNLRSARQPDLVTGGMMRGYQLEGLEWLISLYENGLNGILADEMGLGKTIQTISFLAFLRGKGSYGPFLIAAPLSTTSNWVDEFQRWTPDIPVVLYHGSKQEREAIRRKQLRNPGSDKFPVVCTSYEICMNDRKFLAHFGWKFIIIDEGHRIKNLNCRLIRELQNYQSANRLLITGTPLQNNLSELWSLLNFLMPDIFDKLESFESWFDFSALKEAEGHQQILSEERKSSLVTSLHAILKPFLLRRIKTDVEHSMPKKREYVLFAPLTTEQRELYHEILEGNSRQYLEDKVVESLSRPPSGIATPNSVKSSASKKRKQSTTNGTSTPSKSVKTSRASTPATTNSARGRRAKRQQNYAEISDTEFLKKVDRGEIGDNEDKNDAESDPEEAGRAATLALAKKQVSQKKLQNPVMQLRLCCNSPHNFYDPWMALDEPGNENTSEEKVDYSALVSASGKMILLDRLLRALLAAPAGHKILIFSQFKTQLDLLALYVDTQLNLPVCRIDGSIPASERAEQIRAFNAEPDKGKKKKKGETDEHRIFLLSTRAGGQGINLAAADTVVLFDSDWNPQQDLQAQDRAHRIGQRRNVVVYRLATRGTVEEMLLSKADGKRRLEKLVISKGKFRNWGQEKEQKKKRGRASHATPQKDDEDGGVDDEDDLGEDLDELRRALAQNDGERLDFGGANGMTGDKLLSDADLAVLLDRSDEAYEKAAEGMARGEGKGGVFEAVETKRDGEGLLEGLSK